MRRAWALVILGVAAGCDGAEEEQKPTCGDGVLDPATEVCDDGLANGQYGRCAADCLGTAGTCGDGTVDEPELCDDGSANGTYGACDTECKELGPHCGDGEKQREHELCDDGLLNGEYEHCGTDCLGIPEWCGDGVINGPEVCDDGPDNGHYGHCAGSCDSLGRRCGDGITDKEELCDGALPAPGAICGADCLSSTTTVDLSVGTMTSTNCGSVVGCAHTTVFLDANTFSSSNTASYPSQNYLDLSIAPVDFTPDGGGRSLEFDYLFDNPSGGGDFFLVEAIVGSAEARFESNGFGGSGHASLPLKTRSSFTDTIYITFGQQQNQPGATYSVSNLVIVNTKDP